MEIDSEEMLSMFLDEAFEIYQTLPELLMDLEGDIENTDIINNIFRGFHTIKGGASFLNLTCMVDLCHRSENIFDKIRSKERQFSSTDMDVFTSVLSVIGGYFDQLHDGEELDEYPVELISVLDSMLDAKEFVTSPKLSDAVADDEDLESLFDSIANPPEVDLIQSNDTNVQTKSSIAKSNSNKRPNKPKKNENPSVRVDTSKLDSIFNLVGELVLNRNRLKQVGVEIKSNELTRGLASLDFITSELQSSVMKTRMQPIEKVFKRFPLLVRDLGRSLGKNISIEMVGEDTELDKTLVDSLSDPMIHLIRNSVDHGIEVPEVRVSKGKPEVGVITLKAEQLGDHVEITISDDGKGIDANFMRDKGVEKGLITHEKAYEMSDLEALQIVFLPGFSTASEVTDLSGRGVGMDVVKTTVEGLNGYVQIDSKPDFGTRFTLRIPLTMAIMQTLMCEVDTYNYAIPIPSVSELYFYDSLKVNVVDGQAFARYHDGSIPIFYLSELLPLHFEPTSQPVRKTIVVVSLADKFVGLVVDNIIDLEEVVIKPLGAFISQDPVYAGATITGNGSVALILDVLKLIPIK